MIIWRVTGENHDGMVQRVQREWAGTVFGCKCPRHRVPVLLRTTALTSTGPNSPDSNNGESFV